jgi:hypothetical protein
MTRCGNFMLRDRWPAESTDMYVAHFQSLVSAPFRGAEGTPVKPFSRSGSVLRLPAYRKISTWIRRQWRLTRERAESSENFQTGRQRAKLSSFGRNHRNRFSAGLRTPNFKPSRTFFLSQCFQVMPFANGLRIAHSFGEFAQSLFA